MARHASDVCFVQWALRDPAPPEVVLTGTWTATPSRPEPRPGQIGGNNNTLGWVYCVALGGKVFAGFDHYHVAPISDPILGAGTRITVWNDDLIDWPIGTRRAEVWDWYGPGPDATKRGAINTRWRVTFYEEEVTRLDKRWASADGVPFVMRPWAQFIAPPASETRHGIWLTDANMLAHSALATGHQQAIGWRDYSAHLPDSEVDLVTGRIKPQRTLGRFEPNTRTITWYWTTGAAATALYTAEEERALSRSVGSGSITVDVAAAQDPATIEITLSSPSGDPNQGTWPTGNYRMQMDISSIGTGFTDGSDEPTYTRVNSTLASTVASVAMFVNGDGPGSASITASGIYLFAPNGNTWSPGGTTASDRVLVTIPFGNLDMMTATAVVFTCDADAFVDGPWSEAPAAFLPKQPPPVSQAVNRAATF